MNTENSLEVEHGAEGSFSLRIKFERNSRQPERVFSSMANLIQSMQELDMVIARCVSVDLRPEYILEDVESQSVRAKLKLILLNIEDEHLLNFDWKKIVGKFLFQAKYKILSKLENVNNISRPDQIDEIAKDVDELACISGALQIPSYRAISHREMLNAIGLVSASVGRLGDNDSVEYLHDDDLIVVKDIHVIPVEEYDVLVSECIHEGEHEESLKIRKPDFIGNTGWGFMKNGKNASIKIADDEWLANFKKGDVALRPGDSMRVRIMEGVSKNKRTGSIATTQLITKVLDVYRDEKKALLY